MGAYTSREPFFSKKHTYLIEKDGCIGGFISGTVSMAQDGSKCGYISCLLLTDEIDTSESTTQLLARLECSFGEEGISKAVWSFRNPMHLPWVIPGIGKTLYREAGGEFAKELPVTDCVHALHNNEPGVPCDRPLYRRMEENGYRTLVKQCALYLELENFSAPSRKKELEQITKELGYRIEWFD